MTLSVSLQYDTYLSLIFFFNDTATTEIYTLSLHDALPISRPGASRAIKPLSRLSLVLCDQSPRVMLIPLHGGVNLYRGAHRDRKSTRLNSSHANISYAVFCLKKKK